jgi:hypothetical protein
MKITKQILAIHAAVPATPPKPKIPAISATTKNVNAQLNISIPFLAGSLRACRSADPFRFRALARTPRL